MQVYAYARWSSLEQGAGSTLERQLANCAAFAAERGWTITETLVDRGRSAYTGANIETGELGKFADRVHAGAIRNATLIVEELDRLSRQPADVMLAWLSPLVRRGLTIAVTQTGQVINRDMLDHDMGGLMMLLITAFGSHKESKKKADRVGAAWAKKRRDAAQGRDVQRNHRSPLWITTRHDGSHHAIEERAAIIRRIFDERLRGAGKLLIAKNLNRDGVPTWAQTALAAKMWSATYIGRILTNRAVLGEWQPYSNPRGGSRQPIGEPIANYYPAIIDQETFARANDRRAANQRAHQGRGRSLSNLLGTRTRCDVCGGQMVALGSSRYRTNLDGSRSRHYFLYCQSAKIAKTCDNQRGWTYDRVETPLLDHVLSLAMDDQHFSSRDEVAPVEARVFALREECESIGQRVTRLLDMLEDGDDAMLERYRARKLELTAAQDRLATAEAELEAARGKTSPEQHLRRVKEVRELMDSEDEELRFAARSRVKDALHGLVESMSFSPLSGRVVVRLVEGLRLLTIEHDGTVFSDFDFVHPGRKLATTNPDAKAYLRRNSATTGK